MLLRPQANDGEVRWSKWLAQQMGGESEVRLPDGRRCDIVTEHLAIEVDWVKKWPQAIGQSIAYSLELEKFPAIILLLRGKPTEKKYISYAARACSKAGIPIFTWMTT